MEELFEKYDNKDNSNDITQNTFGRMDTEQSSVLKDTSGRFSVISHTVDHRFSNVNSDYVPSSILQSPRNNDSPL